MTGIQDSLGEVDHITAPRRSSAQDPLATLLASRQIRPRGRANLRALVERDVVPRLVRSFRTERSPVPASLHESSDRLAGAIETFGQMLLASDIDGAAGMVETLEDEGVSLERIYLHLLRPAADHLERLWTQDLLGFAETAVGLHNLLAVLRRFGPAFRQDPGGTGPGQARRVLLLGSPSPGLDAGKAFFDLVFAAEFFRRDNWDTSIEPNLGGDLLRRIISGTWYDVVSIGPCRRRDLDPVAAAIQTIRRFSVNRTVLVMAHGNILVENSELPRLIGADVVSPDAQSSLIQAKQFVSPPKLRVRLR